MVHLFGTDLGPVLLSRCLEVRAILAIVRHAIAVLHMSWEAPQR
jgi:hypothetical protein